MTGNQLDAAKAAEDLVHRMRAGERNAMARVATELERLSPTVPALLAAMQPYLGGALVVGITGPPGSGKSTLLNALIAHIRGAGRSIGVIAVDPSSPVSGGAILGDRIRMSDMANDPGVYIRSMATRGATGGMARAALDAVDILDVAGYDTVIIETVGVGQDEVEIVRASHTTVVVSAPGLGDEIQAIKAGILEIADIHVVSKCDRSDANRTMTDLKQMLMLGMNSADKAEWQPPVIGTSAVAGSGIDELVAAIGKHRRIAFETEAGDAIAKAAAPLAGKLAAREADPYSLANELLDSSLSGGQSHEQDARPKIA
jgi:LAO/AO transport system kinase